MILCCAMQQHLAFLSAFAISLLPLGLFCAIHVRFSELASMGE